MQENHSDCSGVAQHALVWGSSDHVQSNPTELAQSAQPFNQIPHRNLTNLNLHAWLLEPQQSRSRACLRQWQQELRLLKGDQSDQSMRQVGLFTSDVSLLRWTSAPPPPVKSVADFLMYLFQDRKLQPSTIDGYRSAIADRLGNSPIKISKDENLTRPLDSFH